MAVTNKMTAYDRDVGTATVIGAAGKSSCKPLLCTVSAVITNALAYIAPTYTAAPDRLTKHTCMLLEAASDGLILLQL